MFIKINSNPVTYDVSNYYNKIDDYQGVLNLKLGEDVGPELNGGHNIIYLYVTDAIGEQAVASVEVIVKEGLFVEKVLNYPNPYKEDTTITYMLTGEAEEIRGRIYTISGRLVKEFRDMPLTTGYNEYYWDGKDNNNDSLANDVYYLIILAKNKDGKWIKGRSKMVRLK